MKIAKGSDLYNVGHYIVEYMSERPQDICQIDAATGLEETKASVLSRSIRMAKCLRKFGLKPGDVLAIGGKNHLDVHIPFYAAQMNGLPTVGVDPFFKYTELKSLFKIAKPKIAFCQEVMYDEYVQASRDLGLDMKVVAFEDGENGFKTFMETYDDPAPESEFQVATFDTRKIYCWLVSTSGTTGVPKIAAVRHPDLLAAKEFFLIKPRDGKLRTALNLSTMQWISACFFALTLPVHYIKVQSSEPSTTENVINMINKYKPALIMTTANAISPILKSEVHCDLTCFDFMMLGGSIVYEEFLMELRKRVKPDTKIVQGYGQTESLGAVLSQEYGGPFGNCGKPKPSHQVKLVDPSTDKEITEPNVPGELLVKGIRMAEYYGNPEETAAVFTEDGWLRTGDLLYRDENDYYFFVERIKMLLKYRNYQVIPPEVEEVIMTHKDVLSVCVTGVPHSDDGERVVACVMRRPGSEVTAQEIKDLVASKLSVPKHLHGGVFFVDDIPLTSTGKIARYIVREMALTAKIE